MNAIIIEDEVQAADSLKMLLAKYCPEVIVSGCAASFSEAYSMCSSMQPDIVFCDIQLNSAEGTGLDLVRLLGSKKIKVIFITGSKDFAIDAIRANAVDYLLKPINIRELIQAVEKAKQHADISESPATGSLHIPTQHGFLIVPFTDIIRCQAEGPYTHFHLLGKHGKKTSSVNLGAVAEKLPADLFFRVHKTHLINKTHILEYVRGEGGTARMSDNSEVPVSRLLKEEFMKWLG